MNPWEEIKTLRDGGVPPGRDAILRRYPLPRPVRVKIAAIGFPELVTIREVMILRVSGDGRVVFKIAESFLPVVVTLADAVAVALANGLIEGGGQ